jgi:hypothetical protein
LFYQLKVRLDPLTNQLHLHAAPLHRHRQFVKQKAFWPPFSTP